MENHKADFERQLRSAELLVARLERLSADSYWAHQASGLRGSLLRCLDQARAGHGKNADGSQEDIKTRLDQLVDRGYEILVLAAQDMYGPVI
jgi:hypothetical protein